MAPVETQEFTFSVKINKRAVDFKFKQTMAPTMYCLYAWWNISRALNLQNKTKRLSTDIFQQFQKLPADCRMLVYFNIAM
jgi:hypothetical protein